MINRLAYLWREPQPNNYEDAVPRPKGEPKTKIGTYLPTALYEALLDFSDASGVPVTRVLEDAVRAYLKRQRWDLGEYE